MFILSAFSFKKGGVSYPILPLNLHRLAENMVMLWLKIGIDLETVRWQLYIHGG